MSGDKVFERKSGNVVKDYTSYYQLLDETPSEVEDLIKTDPNLHALVGPKFWRTKVVRDLSGKPTTEKMLNDYARRWGTDSAGLMEAVEYFRTHPSELYTELVPSNYKNIEKLMILSPYPALKVLASKNEIAAVLYTMSHLWRARVEARLGYNVHNKKALNDKINKWDGAQPQMATAARHFLKTATELSTFRNKIKRNRKYAEMHEKPDDYVVEAFEVLLDNSADVDTKKEALDQVKSYLDEVNLIFVTFNRYDTSNKYLNEVIVLKSSNIDSLEKYIMDSEDTGLAEYFLEFLYSGAKLVKVAVA